MTTPRGGLEHRQWPVPISMVAPRMAMAYTLVGIWRGARWAVAGIFLGLGTIAGFMLFPAHFMLWMARTAAARSS